jgi:hypothetical protein
MILTLKLRNPEAVPGAQPEFKLARRDALIGRSKSCDWSLPDEKSFISSKHAQISFRDDGYYLKDISTNGTLLNGGSQRMADERKIEPGDVFRSACTRSSPSCRGRGLGTGRDGGRERRRRRTGAGFRRQHEHVEPGRGRDGIGERSGRPRSRRPREPRQSAARELLTGA